MKSNLLRVLLNCGELDINKLLNVTYDWYDIFEYEPVVDFDFNTVMRSAIIYGLGQLQEEINDRVDELESIDEITDEEKEELEELKKLDVEEDFDIYLNYIDTHLTCIQHQDIYNEYLKEAIDRVGTALALNVEGI